ncbi:hypothetical protein NP233_g1191 [Leucocoprinus birnbaumii]|uniref:Ubiquitin 3 binding protein But2 C-terminal domain-containing protein n=1 Tax=Leucocoprinus birnbaumii TaxID=56174 RepID=A0AAD5W0U5_9AGAR|nr:hypothetical protein NP233_g1191 [Leucocoprinus birnbaumii]
MSFFARLQTPWSNLSKPNIHTRDGDNQPLLRGHEPGVDTDVSLDDHKEKTPNKFSEKPSGRFPLILNVILTLFNLTLVLFAWYSIKTPLLETSFYPLHRLTRKEISQLRRPSQWINLEKMYGTTSPPPRQFKNWPLILAPVDPGYPDTALGHDPKRHLTLIGFISPEEREFRVSSKVSAIAQFRAIDFKMENCQLILRPPPDTVSNVNTLEIYELDQSLPIMAKDLTFSNRPRRKSPLALTNVYNGSEWKYNFACPTDTLFTFEFACQPGAECDVSWWQAPGSQNPGLFLIQSSAEMS